MIQAGFDIDLSESENSEDKLFGHCDSTARILYMVLFREFLEISWISNLGLDLQIFFHL